MGDVDAAFAGADYVRQEEFHTNRHTANPMETRGLVASYDTSDGHMRVWGPTKVSHTNRAILSRHLEIDEERIHFIEPDVGGGFGVRGEFYAEDFLIPFASFRLGRAVKWVEDRVEHLTSANHSREVLCQVELAARNDGTLLGLRATVYGDMGRLRSHPRQRSAGPDRRDDDRAVSRPQLPRLGQLRDDQQDGRRHLPRPRLLRGHLHPRADAGPRRRRPGQSTRRNCAAAT